MSAEVFSATARSVITAMQLLTRLPMPAMAPPTPADYGRSVLVYPLVGLLIGLLLALALGLLRLLPGAAPDQLQAAILLALWVAVTGALHLDGLADSVDAWVGGLGDRERSLRILKDPTSGPMAVSAVVVLLLLKFSALAALLVDAPWPWLLAAPLLGRCALVAAFLFIPYARPHGLGSEQATQLPRAPALTLVGMSLAAIILLCGVPGLAAVLVSIVVFLLLRRATLRRLQGFTGDIAGALCELTETAVLVTLALAVATVATAV